MNTKPKNMENPIMKTLLAELRSTPWRFDRPTAVTVANNTQNNPPMIGSGIHINAAPHFPISANIMITTLAAWITRRAPTLVTLMAPIFSL